MKQSKTPLIVGHRGARGNVPDNTREAFEWAIEHGAAEIETDSRLTSDGYIVQFHDPEFVDTAGKKHKISTSTYAEVKTALPYIVTLQELIEFVGRRSRLMLEIKPGVPAAPIISTIRKYIQKGWSPDDFSFASFDFQILKDVHRELPQVERIVLESWSAIRALYRAKQVNTASLSLDQQFVWWGFVLWAARHNHKIYTYPSKHALLPLDHKKPAKWAKHGLHGIITDKPEIFN